MAMLSESGFMAAMQFAFVVQTTVYVDCEGSISCQQVHVHAVIARANTGNSKRSMHTPYTHRTMVYVTKHSMTQRMTLWLNLTTTENGA